MNSWLAEPFWVNVPLKVSVVRGGGVGVERDRLVVRGVPEEGRRRARADVALGAEQLGNALVSRPSRAPSQRYLLHSGYQPQTGGSSGGYYSGFLTTFTGGINPRPNAPGVAKRIVFVTDGGENLPLAAIDNIGQGCRQGPADHPTEEAAHRIVASHDLEPVGPALAAVDEVGPASAVDEVGARPAEEDDGHRGGLDDRGGRRGVPGRGTPGGAENQPTAVNPLERLLDEAALAMIERAQPLPPLPDEVRKGMESDIADISQTNSNLDRAGHMLQGGVFLREFVTEGVEWALHGCLNRSFVPRSQPVPATLLAEGARAVGYFTGFITRGPILARRILEAMSEKQFRTWANRIILVTLPPAATQ